MKTIKFRFAMMWTLFVAIASQGQEQGNELHFLSIDQALKDTVFIGPPPAFGSLLFEHDIQMFYYGKTLRNTERGKQAVQDADCSTSNLCAVFSEAFGTTLSKEKTPEIYKLIDTMREDVGSYSTRLSKSKWNRVRPYVLFSGPRGSTGVPEDEDALRNNGSYVSGHSAIGVAVAMTLASINLSRQNELYKRGLSFGDSRWILSFHWYSDVKAGQLVGALVLPALMNCDEFIQQLNRAKVEFKKLLEMQKATSYHQTRRLPRGVD